MGGARMSRALPCSKVCQVSDLSHQFNIQNDYGTGVNYFDNRSTNSSAEYFNPSVKTFGNQFHEVRNIPFLFTD